MQFIVKLDGIESRLLARSVLKVISLSVLMTTVRHMSLVLDKFV